MRMARLLSLAVVTMSLCASIPVGAQQPVAPPPPQIPYGVPISLEQAKKVMAGAEAEAKKNGWNVVIAVLDSGGVSGVTSEQDAQIAQAGAEALTK